MIVRRLAPLLAALALWGCASSAPPATVEERAPYKLDAADAAFLDTLERRTFQWFWEVTDARTGLTPDRWPTRSFVSVAATGFALTAYPIGAERGWVTRAQARDRALATLRFFQRSRQDTAARGSTGYRGFYYHFLDSATGVRFGDDVELSTVDTALLMAGVLFCQSYFDRADAQERALRAVADSLYDRIEWTWAQPRAPAIVHGWSPEEGFLPYDWRGYNEAMLVYVMALGSTTHPVDSTAWTEWTSHYQWGEFQGEPHVNFPPLFGHQYSHVWVDFRGIQDTYMRGRKIDYFENSRRATVAQRDYAIANPGGWVGYGARLWGLTACDGPVDGTFTVAGRRREFHTYWARGASMQYANDDGTIAPTAAAGSIVFEPSIVLPTLRAMREDWGDRVFTRHGFVDAFNPTFRINVPVQMGVVDTALGWVDHDQLGIDQGPIVAMVENLRSELVWRTMRRNPHIVRGLRAAGFRGGWLDHAAATP